MWKKHRRRFLLYIFAAPVFLWFFLRPQQRDGGFAEAEELVQNGGFEEAGDGTPLAWTRDLAETGDKGLVSVDTAQFRSGLRSLRLEPNGKNDRDHPLAVSQVVEVGRLRGKRVRIQGYLRAEGEAAAVLAVLSLVRGKPVNLAGMGQPGGGEGWVQHQREYDVPDDGSAQLLVICSVNGKSGVAWFDDVSVIAGDAAAAPSEPLAATVSVHAAEVLREIPAGMFGANVEWIWNGNLLWREKENRPDPELLRLTKELGVTLLRYPGGYYSDFYHWRDGTGAPEKRPEAVHDGSGKDRSRPYFGTREALEFAAAIGAELLITVNAGTGSAKEAADWVSYVNRDRLAVRYWEVGNELYINDGSPISKAITVDPETYARRFREFAAAMKAVDPRIRVGAIGGENQGPYAFVHYKDWNRIVLEGAGDVMDFFAIHNAYAPVSISDGDDVRAVYRAMLAAPVWIARNLQTVERQIRTYVPQRADAIPIAVTEWGPLFQVDPRGAFAQHTNTLGSALYAASAFKALLESPKTEIANFHVLNDLGFMGWIANRDGTFPPRPEWVATPRYHAFQMFSRHFGRKLVRVETKSPGYETAAVGAVGAAKGIPYLDAISSLGADGRTLYILAINKHFDNAIRTSITLEGFEPEERAAVWTLNGSGIDANPGTKPLQAPGLVWGKQKEDRRNPRFSEGGPGEIRFTSSTIGGVKSAFEYEFPAHSVTSLALKRR